MQSVSIRFHCIFGANFIMHYNFEFSFCVGFTISCGVPKVGVLLYAAWNLTDTGRFKLISPPAPDRQDNKDKKDQSVSFHMKFVLFVSISLYVHMWL